MRVTFTGISFGERIETFKNGKNLIIKRYDDNNTLTKNTEYDEFWRSIDEKEYDKSGNQISHMHKEYSKDGLVETFKGRFIEYIRKIRQEQKGEFSHRIEEYTSKTNPANNYVSEIIRNKAGKLVKIIIDDKILELK